ncbi:MAG: sugar phosphate isomerase/epimerase [Opitutaceae bacterium]|jgi:sugar phosphate isomerase/epimerase|nr:sugar phosphate isomerase/epimerase [Opitutaceae bacterium]
MKKIPIALQLWSVRDMTKNDFADTVAQVAKIGYAGVELAGYGNLDAAGAAAAVRAAGLKVAGMHVGIAALRADLSKVAAEALLLGSSHVTCPYFQRELFRSGASCAAIGEEMNAIGERLRAYGLRFSYHNHDFELALVDGRRGFDWLLDAAQPRNLGCEADVYWVHVGGKNPADFIREQGRRIELLHLKDEAEIGGGPVDFAAVFSAVQSIGSVEWYIVEVEKYHHTPIESVRRSFEQLRSWGCV